MGDTPSGLTDLLRRAAARSPERTAVVDGDRRETWTELDTAVSETAAGHRPPLRGENLRETLERAAEKY